MNRSLVILIDALDEADGEGEARLIAQRLLRPIARPDRNPPVGVLVGTRRGPGGELIRALGDKARVIDLDDERYFDAGDIAEYVRRRLLREDDTTVRTPYRGERNLAHRVSAGVAGRANRSFLIAQLVSRSLIEVDDVVNVNSVGWQHRFPATVGDAMEDYLACFDRYTKPQEARQNGDRREGDRHRVRDLLRALAYAEK